MKNKAGRQEYMINILKHMIKICTNTVILASYTSANVNWTGLALYRGFKSYLHFDSQSSRLNTAADSKINQSSNSFLQFIIYMVVIHHGTHSQSSGGANHLGAIPYAILPLVTVQKMATHCWKDIWIPGLFLNATTSAKSDRSSLRNSCTNGPKINLQYKSTFSGYFMGVGISIDVCMHEHTYMKLLNS